MGITLLLSFTAKATLISADFRTEANLPDYRNGLPLIYETLGQSIGAGAELNNTHFVQNPDNWSGGVVWMDFDAATNILTLDSQDLLDFQIFDAWISNIVFSQPGQSITGISLLSDDLTDVGVVPGLSFTADSLHISYDSMPDIFNFTGGSATFQIELGETDVVAVPEPLPLTLLGLGLVGLVLTRRKQTAN
ncbi:PEP-CTERM sorting domain-containing protein [Lacimicrobium alkaliphilum]|uniref:PEP-CTERM sorting domain-containing protein n=1 Tax=Lacimicrobium alkaliphilum TaxID=1526571 RepID=UPI0018D26C97|nr:PEP-CTERM sorting domain-containing protein [Lacimicrobium alkaliphilum]